MELSDRMADIAEMAVGMLNDANLAGRVDAYVPAACDAVLCRALPYAGDDALYDDVPQRYDSATARIVAYLVSREGSEGETYHSENGTVRQYDTGDIPASYFAGIVPRVGVPS